MSYWVSQMMKATISLLLAPAALATVIVPVQAQQISMPTETILIAQGSDPVSVAQDFINKLGQRQFATAVQEYDAIAQDVSTQSIQQYWNDILATSGAFQQIIDAQLIAQSGPEAVVLVSCQFERDRRDLFVLLADDGVTSFNVVE
ncbi:hypothetical protein ACQ4M4_10000 [Leptolyngbya sp. AN02str]|uniref:hypothetical protein n=1 Tax=Leptolyngbya sp. AN02str TaxID=3423363 RepID=UPI003D321A2F